MEYEVTRKRLARERSLPGIPAAVGSEAHAALSAMREQVERLSGKAGEDGDRAVRMFEVEGGLLARFLSTEDVSRGTTPGAGGSRILKAPRNLQYRHEIFAIILTWENVETDYSHVEIWCATGSSVLDDARRVGIATKPMAEWIFSGVSMREPYTFWIRAVGWDGSVSPWCPPQGQGGLIVPPEVSRTIEEILDALVGKITESQLYQALSDRIALIDAADAVPGSVAARIKDERVERVAGDHALAQSVTTLQSVVNGQTASLQQHASVLDGVKAQYFVKTDVNGRVAGFGLYNEGVRSEFIVLADKFMVVVPGQTPKVPFVVGPLGTSGQYGVGIDGSLVVNGTILTRHLDAYSVTVDKLAADSVGARAFNARESFILNEGGRLTVGNNNLILDSVADSLIVAPDNGTKPGSPNLNGVDYAELKDGSLVFRLWANGAHHPYMAMNRSIDGVGVSGTPVEIPGYFKTKPKVMAQPLASEAFHPDYPNQRQRVTVDVSEPTQFATYRWRFTPTIRHEVVPESRTLRVRARFAFHVSTTESGNEYTFKANVNHPEVPTGFLMPASGHGSAALHYSVGKPLNLPWDWMQDVMSVIRIYAGGTLVHERGVRVHEMGQMLVASFSVATGDVVQLSIVPKSSTRLTGSFDADVAAHYAVTVDRMVVNLQGQVVNGTGGVRWFASGI